MSTPPNTTIPIPADFAVRARCELSKDLCDAYGVSPKTLRKWRRQLGIPSPQRTDSAVRRQCALRGAAKRHGPGGAGRRAADPVKPKQPLHKWQWVRPAVIVRDTRDLSTASLARDFLQRDGWKVYRCDEMGRPDQKGALWRVGNLVLNEDEMIAKAARKGFGRERLAA